jgi:hypothetical protein
MNIEEVQSLCKQLLGVTEYIKWGSDLCFSVGGKMFLVTGLEQSPIELFLTFIFFPIIPYNASAILQNTFANQHCPHAI